MIHLIICGRGLTLITGSKHVLKMAARREVLFFDFIFTLSCYLIGSGSCNITMNIPENSNRLKDDEGWATWGYISVREGSLVGHLLRVSVIEYKQEIMNYMILRMRYVKIILKNNNIHVCVGVVCVISVGVVK